MAYKVPTTIQTERLTLRQFKEEDWTHLHQYYSSETATKYTVGRPFSEAETWRAMASMVGHWGLRGYGPYALQLKESDLVIGIVGFWYPNDWPSPEIKWALAPEYWGQGYASEAGRAVQQAGSIHLPDIDLISLIHKDNAQSIQLATALGAAFEREIHFRGAHWHIYRHPNT